MGQFGRKIISFQVTKTDFFRQNKDNKHFPLSNNTFHFQIARCRCITFCGFMIFVYIVLNLILQQKTIPCISIINKWCLVEAYKKLIRNLSETFEAVFDIFCVVLRNLSACFSKIQFLSSGDAL